MNAEVRLQIEERIIAMLKTVFDPEIPVNVYDLGLIYKIDLQDDGEAIVDITHRRCDNIVELSICELDAILHSV